MFFVSSFSIASDEVTKPPAWEICYEPIYSISERPSTMRSFPKTCTPLGRLEYTQERYRDLALAIGNLDIAVNRAEKAASRRGAIDFNTIRVKISMGPDVMFIDKTGSGVFRGQTFLLSEENMSKIERVLGALHECMEYREELKKQSNCLALTVVNAQL
ncbi:hypothetical protein [Massilia genomosp. 1]|uniref:Uncharacterized protein n=1 Tax=Massilia genomosp. 1 TaxID=2609280 RepID=A0ABX0MZH6_9BURK|nr:hypothetical protein [Massilia genomosp. 1]NHZ65646.1 hypothetical protein [Massilia genomosp. 1]